MSRESLQLRLLLGAIALGVALRVLLIAISFGSNDMVIWTRFAEAISEHGLWQTYRALPEFNHPPLMGALAEGLHRLSEWTAIPLRVWFKLPPLLADLAAMGLLWTCWRPKGALVAASAVALYSCNPVSILITGFHGNTDSLCAALMLLAAFGHARRRWLLAGLAVAAAVNVKIVALMIVPGLVLLCPRWPDALRFGAGLGLGCLPFLFALIEVPDEFYRNALAYGSNVERWGVLAAGFYAYPSDPEAALRFIVGYREIGRAIVLALLALFALFGLAARWRRDQWGEWDGSDAYRSGAAALAVFLVFAPGFGVQYLVWIVPLLAATSMRFSLAWAGTAGLFALLVYRSFLLDEWPLRSSHSVISAGVGVFGVIAWGVLVLYLAEQVRRYVRAPSR